MTTFKTALHETLHEMRAFDDNLCCAVYNDDICNDNAMVMFMEYGGYGTMHNVMSDLYAKLSAKLGFPVSLTHNHSTDENVLIHGEPDMASVYLKDECCKEDTIRCCLEIIGKSAPGYREAIRSIAVAAQCLADGLDKTPEYILRSLDWDQDVQTQLIKLLVDYHA